MKQAVKPGKSRRKSKTYIINSAIMGLAATILTAVLASPDLLLLVGELPEPWPGVIKALLGFVVLNGGVNLGLREVTKEPLKGRE